MSTRILIFSYTRVSRNETRNVVYVVMLLSADTEGFSDEEFSSTVAHMPYTRFLKTARRIARAMDARECTECGIREVRWYKNVEVVDDLEPYPFSIASIPETLAFPDTPMPTPMQLQGSKWLLLSKIRDLETALAAARFQLEHMDQATAATSSMRVFL